MSFENGEAEKCRRKSPASTPAHPHDRSSAWKWGNSPPKAPGAPGPRGRPWGSVQVVPGFPAPPRLTRVSSQPRVLSHLSLRHQAKETRVPLSAPTVTGRSAPFHALSLWPALDRDAPRGCVSSACPTRRVSGQWTRNPFHVGARPASFCLDASGPPPEVRVRTGPVLTRVSLHP